MGGRQKQLIRTLKSFSNTPLLCNRSVSLTEYFLGKHSLHCTFSGAVRVMLRETSVEAIQGDSVVLPCSFFTISPLSRLSIIWTMTPLSDPDSPAQVIVFDHGQVIASPAFTGRIAFTGIPWSADVVLNRTRVSDAGVYRCVVSNPPETGDPGIGELSLTVLAPPSLPVCLWEGDTDAGGSVTLSCGVAEGVPTPTIRWEKLQPNPIALPTNMESKNSALAEAMETHHDRSKTCSFFPHSPSGDMSGSVHIANVSSQTSGLYRCSVTNLLGSQNCYINLSVYSPPHSTPGILQGVLVTLSMAVVLLALLVLVLWLHRSEQERKWRNGREEAEEEDECYNEIRYTPSLIKRSFV
ncbi:immunoglobulin superfamily member 11 isoform X1 [Denticeps clupeoides]|uniref:immunoglobulin superfamily member 11 isoform X1 n=1 Tax=Denticeps clupeoides TaxID=299321 RepID=UPI0010A42CD0|nr:immunoglobulin superfamily member 11-like isoform X1 [Denticeps clupeoides]